MELLKEINAFWLAKPKNPKKTFKKPKKIMICDKIGAP